MAVILVDEMSDEDNFELQITMEVVSGNFRYLLERQPLYETDGEDPNNDLEKINKFINHAEDVANDFGMDLEVSSIIKADIKELKNIMVSDERL